MINENDNNLDNNLDNAENIIYVSQKPTVTDVAVQSLVSMAVLGAVFGGLTLADKALVATKKLRHERRLKKLKRLEQKIHMAQIIEAVRESKVDQEVTDSETIEKFEESKK